MDYYLVHGRAEGLLLEEFARRGDFTAAGLWSSDGGLSRRARTDAVTAACVIPVSRARAEEVSGPLPSEDVLRTSMRDYDELPAASPLRLGASRPPAGFREERLYRVLFAKRPAATEPESAEFSAGDDRYSWRLHAIAHGLAWALDLTVLLKDGKTIAGVLDRLTDLARFRHGLIPVTTERLY